MKYKKNTRIKWVDYGVGNSFSFHYNDKSYKVIMLNKGLTDDKELLKSILNHEDKHTTTKKLINIKDIKIDMPYTFGKKEDIIPPLRYLSFLFRSPKNLIQILPFIKYTNKKTGNTDLHWDINLILLYILGFIISSTLIIFLV